MLHRSALSLALLLTLLLPQASTAQAPQAPETLDVGLFVDPPFVIADGGRFSGMAVELWENIAAELELPYRYVELETVGDLVEATASGQVDVAVTNLTINRPRAQLIDFTQPWFDGGMRIMVGSERRHGFRSLIAGLGDAGFLRAYAWIALVVVGATVVLTLFDRRFDAGFPTRWRDGIAESFFSVMSIATTGKPPSRKNLFGWMGRIWQGVWLICGIAVLAFVTSSVTSVMTTLSLANQIHGVTDLAGKRVGVLSGSIEADYAQEQALQTRAYPGLADAVDGLLNGEVSAVIADAPVLEYHVHTHPDLPLQVVGPLFQPDKYGFAVPQQSPLRSLLTVELLGALASGEVDDLKTRYFGTHH
jgi:polar amino acid transport system substrate-binding protein